MESDRLRGADFVAGAGLWDPFEAPFVDVGTGSVITSCISCAH